MGKSEDESAERLKDNNQEVTLSHKRIKTRMSTPQFEDDDKGYPDGYVLMIESSLNPSFPRPHRALAAADKIAGNSSRWSWSSDGLDLKVIRGALDS